jgi:multiple sugar transport system ATP-binding protein
VRDPTAFLFDEPLSNLDAALRVNMRIEIMQLHKDLKKTMIYVTHDQVEAMTMADRIVVLNKGHIEQVGTPLELYNKPDSLFVAGFIGSPKMNLIGGAMASEHGAATIGIRPEHIRIGAAGSGVAGVVAIAEHLGSDTFLHVDAGAHGMIVARAPGEAGLEAGASIGLAFDTTRLHRFDGTGRAIRS